MKIITERYIIRQWSETDCESVARYADDIRIWNQTRDHFPHPYTLHDAQAFYRLTLDKSYPQDFVIEIGGEAAGGIGFVPQTDVERLSAEIGYWLGAPFRGQGIMSDAVGKFAQRIFSGTPILRLFATVFECNTASMRVLEKAGFRKIAVFRDAAVKNDRIIDLHYFELLKAGNS